MKLWFLKFKEVQYNRSFFLFEFIDNHVIGLKFINHEGKDYFRYWVIEYVSEYFSGIKDP